jgi:hypothetical protein
MNHEEQIYRELAGLVRYNGDNFVEGPDTMAAAKKYDEQARRTDELGRRVAEAELFDVVPRTDVKRGDLVLRHWAGGGYSIEQVVRVDVDDSERFSWDGSKLVPSSEPWVYVVTTQTGGRFRTLGFMGGPASTATERRIRTMDPATEEAIFASIEAELRPLDVVLDEADDLIADLDELGLLPSSHVEAGSLLAGPEFEAIVEAVVADEERPFRKEVAA